MNYCDQSCGDWLTFDRFEPKDADSASFVLICSTREMEQIQQIYGFDEATVRNCMDLDESVRFGSYVDYDFISMVHTEEVEDRALVSELNLYFSNKLLILVLPDKLTIRIARLIDDYKSAIIAQRGQGDLWLSRALYDLLHLLLQDVSAALETLEDNMEHLQDTMMASVNKKHIDAVAHYHKICYTMKKHMRAMADVGELMIVNDNAFLPKTTMRYFRSIASRLDRLRDYAASLYEFSNSLQNTFDSKIQGKMNDAINKLTIVTVFFGPLTLITGIYGMNFMNMPELHWLYGYPMVIGLMALITIVVYLLFKKSEWL